MLRTRVWIYHPYLNILDRRVYKLRDEELKECTLYFEEKTSIAYGDGIGTVVDTNCPFNVLVKQPNYLLIYKGTELEARYFVESFTVKSGEYAKEIEDSTDIVTCTATLVRDVLVDFADKYQQNLFKCKRGHLDDNIFTPLLVQDESIACNQIKVKQQAIEFWDASTQWVTIFYAQQANPIKLKFTDTSSATVDFNDYKNAVLAIPTATQDNRNFKYTINRDCDTVEFTVHIWFGLLNSYYRIKLNVGTKTVEHVETTENILLNRYDSLYYYLTTLADWNELATALNTVYKVDNNVKDKDIINKYDGEVFAQNTNLYKIVANDMVNSDSLNNENNNAIIQALEKLCAGAIIMANIQNAELWKNNDIVTYQKNTTRELGAEILESTEIDLPMEIQLDDLNMCCITIPVGVNTVLVNNGTEYTMSRDSILSLLTEGFTNAGTQIYDIQVLPYCPYSELNSKYLGQESSTSIDISSVANKVEIKGLNNQVVYYGFSIRNASGGYYGKLEIQVDNIKMDSITKFCRIVSNDHQQAFDFKPSSNNGLQYIYLEYSLRPLSTIYRIVPVFNNNSLYGGNYKDTRGLIWKGGFSVSQVTNAWTEYKLQNSTFQATFDREIQNLEYINDKKTTLENLQYNLGVAGDIVNTVQGGTTGFMFGSMSKKSNIPIIGAGVTAVAGLANTALNATRNYYNKQTAQDLRAESIALKKDLFALSNQAIQARPNTFANGTELSTLTNGKAYIEYYDCSETEKEQIRYYLQLQSYTVNAFGSISGYLKKDEQTFIQGVFVFANGIPPMIAQKINEELALGVYYVDGRVFANGG